MYAIIDTFNNRVISTHYTLANAEKAERSFDRKVKRANGNAAHIPTIIVEGYHYPMQSVDCSDLVDCR